MYCLRIAERAKSSAATEISFQTISIATRGVHWTCNVVQPTSRITGARPDAKGLCLQARSRNGAFNKELSQLKCLIINVLYPPIIFGGAEKSVALLATGLARYGHDVTVVSLHPKNSQTVEEIDGVTVYRLPIDNIYWPYGAIEKRGLWRRIKWHTKDMWNSQAGQRVAAIIKEVKPDVVHTNNIRGMSVSVWGAARRLGVPVIHTLRDYSIMCIYGGMFRSGANCKKQCVECWAFSQIRNYQSKKIDAIVSNSQSVLTTHQRADFFFNVKSHVIFNIGRNPSVEYNVNTDPEILSFGYIGRIEPMKGVEIILQAIARMKPGKWRLVIAGRGSADYEISLKERFPSSEIVWLGFVDPLKFYSLIDVCLVPSIWGEPLPRALLESFSYGKSAICSMAGGNLEAAALGRQVASYPAEDVDALVAILSNAIDHPAPWKAGGFASAGAEAQISENAIVKKYTEAYELAIASMHPSRVVQGRTNKADR